MSRPYRQITVERKNDVCCARLRQRRLDETQIHEFAEDLLGLVSDEGCTKLVLSLGPGAPECLYSVFLAKLISVQKRLRERGGAMKLCDASPDVLDVFDACKLREHFDFAPDMKTAVADFGK